MEKKNIFFVVVFLFLLVFFVTKSEGMSNESQQITAVIARVLSGGVV